jgi:hypothetical protein
LTAIRNMYWRLLHVLTMIWSMVVSVKFPNVIYIYIRNHILNISIYIYSICIYTYTFTYHILINNICPMQIYIGYQPLTNGMSVQLPEGLANLLLHEEAIRVEPQENAAFI